MIAIEIDKSLLCSLLTTGTTLEAGYKLHTVKGVPFGARLVASQINSNSNLVLVFQDGAADTTVPTNISSIRVEKVLSLPTAEQMKLLEMKKEAECPKTTTNSLISRLKKFVRKYFTLELWH